MFPEEALPREPNLKRDMQSPGLRYWMDRVLQECDSAADFQPDPVHDLRVALRRCRSLADGIIAMDPDPEWKAMKKAGKRLFQSLGALRDVQIMMEWIENLDLANVAPISASRPSDQPADAHSAAPCSEQHADAAAQELRAVLEAREIEHKQQARAALDEFDRRQWRRWSETLPNRAGRVRLGSGLFRHLALERWTAARQLHTRAMRTRSEAALHSLRIGIKRFRYIVENFLPEEHKLWGSDLKCLQDLLGEVHDLDVLWATAVESGVLRSATLSKAWHERIVAERQKRVEEYRVRATGKESVWSAWRAGLPHGNEIAKIATQRLKLWAKALDPDSAHSEQVAKLALQLYDGLKDRGLLPHVGLAASHASPDDARASLYLGALLHDVGKVKGNKGHAKRSLQLIGGHGTPLGLTAQTMQRAALLARFHSGALPRKGHKLLRDLLGSERRNVIRLAAILRLANALDADHEGRVRRVNIEKLDRGKARNNGFLRKPAPLAPGAPLMIGAEGLVDGSRTAQAVAAERYLLETVLRRPVIVKAASVSRPLRSPRHAPSPVRRSA